MTVPSPSGADEGLGSCGKLGTRPADCALRHPCCAIHARENPGQPCLACSASRGLRAQVPNFYAREARAREQRSQA